MENKKILVIDPLTKTISPKYRNQKAVYVAKHDHNSVKIHFEIPKEIDGYDITKGTVIHIHYVNIDGKDGSKYSKGFSDATDIKTTDEKTVSFSWLIPKTATRYAGVVSIGVTVEAYEEVDGKTEEIYSWSTLPYGNTVVWDSHDNDVEAVEREYNYLVATCNAIVAEALKLPMASVEGLKQLANDNLELGATAVVQSEQSAKNAKLSEDNAYSYAEQAKSAKEEAETAKADAETAKVDAEESARNAKTSEETIVEKYNKFQQDMDGAVEKLQGQIKGHIWKQYLTDAYFRYDIKETYKVYHWELYYFTTAGDDYTLGEEAVTYNDDQPPKITGRGDYYSLKSIETLTGEFECECAVLFEVGAINVPAVGSYYGGETEIISRTIINAPTTKTTFTGRYVINDDENYLPEDGFNEADDFWYTQIGALATEDYVNDKVSDVVNPLDERVADNKSDIQELQEAKAVFEEKHELFEENINELSSHVTEAKKSTSDNKSRIEDLENSHEELSGNILDMRGKINKLPDKSYVDNNIFEKREELLAKIETKANAEDVNNALEEKAHGVNGIAKKALADEHGNNIKDTYATKQVVNDLDDRVNIVVDEIGVVNSKVKQNTNSIDSLERRFDDLAGEIQEVSEEAKKEIEAVGEQVRNSIPDDYSVLSAKMNDTSNALKGKASGTVVSMKDVSPIEHRVDVKLSSKNLFEPSILLEANFSQTDDGYYTGSSSALHRAFNQSNGTVGGLYTNFKPDTQYVFSFIGRNSSKNDNTTRFLFKYLDGTVSEEFVRISSTTDTFLEVKSTYGKTVVGLYATYYNTDTIYLKNLQLEEGTVATPYTPLVEDVSKAKLYRTGKNLLDGSIRKEAYTNTTTGNTLTIQYLEDEDCYLLNGTSKSAWGNFYKIDKVIPLCKKGKSYIMSNKIISGTCSKDGQDTVFIIAKGDTPTETIDHFAIVEISQSKVSKPSVLDKNYVTSSWFFIKDGVVFDNLKIKLQLEEGTVATDYEPYISPIEVNPSEVTSIYPTTTLYSDTVGVKIDAEYNKDANKVVNGLQAEISELRNAILSLGGNI